MGEFKADKAQRAVDFIQKLCTHTKGRWAGHPFRLLRWQYDLIWRLFGQMNDKGYRQYSTCYCEIPKKNGKSELAAAVALKMLVADDEEGAEVYSAAADRDQAAIVFNVAARMVENKPVLKKRIKVIDSQKRMVDYKTGSIYRVLSAEAFTKHGYNPSAIIFDELHAQQTRDLWEVLTEGTGDARTQQLIFAITTAGYDRLSICWEQHEYADKVLRGIIDDPTYLPIIYGVPDDADWEDEREWVKANPSIGEILDIDKIRAQHLKAKEMPARQNAFRRLRLNQWTQQADRAIDLSLWDANAGDPIDEDKLLERTCYGGLDLAAVSDLTAWVMAFPDDDDPEQITILPRFWCPEARLTDPKNKYREHYSAWKKQGFLLTTPGDATDYAFIKKQVLDDAKRFRLIDMNADRLFQGHQLCIELAEEGVELAAMGMGFVSMAAPYNEFERRLLAHKIRHGGNPVLRWMADNLTVKTDPAGNKKPDKANSQGKIDGIVGMIMALDRCMRHENARSVYDGMSSDEITQRMAF